MENIAGVRFKKSGKVYYFDGNGLDLKGDLVIVETVAGTACGELIFAGREIPDDKIVKPLQKVLRMATQEDREKLEKMDERRDEAIAICAERIAAHQLEMKLIDATIAFDNEKITFYFTADGRVDFRELVKDLAHIFRTRIDLRQVGVRDEIKMMGGIGSCGRTCCCASFLRDFVPVSIKMAKEQGLSLNPTKISGQCGRLMCCLKYEQDYYEEARKEMPKNGKEVKTPDGDGTIVDSNVLKKTARVKVTLPDGSMDIRTYTVEDLQRAEQGLPPVAKETKEEPVYQDYEVSETRPAREKKQDHSREEERTDRKRSRGNRDGRENREPKEKREVKENQEQEPQNSKPRVTRGFRKPARPNNQNHDGSRRPEGQKNEQGRHQNRNDVVLRPAEKSENGQNGQPHNNSHRRRRPPHPTQRRETVRLVPADRTNKEK